MLKNHYCGDLRDNHIGQTVMLAGWVNRRRDHGGLIFIDLRDSGGIVQVVFNPEKSPSCHQLAESLRSEFVIQVEGVVMRRPEGTENPAMTTGDVEVLAGGMTILNTSKTPPFSISEESEVDEAVRLKYRHLDLRRGGMFQNLKLRHRIIKYIHSFLDSQGFIEVETPILIKSTPEGARDYLVPSRIYPGKFYALPQSPQQLKQLLMVAGVEKYYQIARCFRDEDLRADRQPEFTQFDMEMSFVIEEDILGLMEEFCFGLVAAVRPDMELKSPLPRLSYAEAIQRFGVDKPDLRFGMEIGDISDIIADSTFSIFSGTVKKGGKVKGIAVPGCGGYNKNQLDELNQMARELGAAGVVPLGLGSEKVNINDLTIEMIKSVTAKHLSIEQVRQIVERLNASTGDLLLFVAGEENKIMPVMGELRCRLGKRLGLASPCEFAFCFVVDFPLFEINKETGRLDALHHPFTSPKEEDIPLLDSEPEKVGSRAYDIVLNGYEIASGSIRIHETGLQRKIFKLLGYNDEEVNARFGQLLEAFAYGAPPHGGIAAGIDRLAMIMAGEDSIREVIAFPKNQNAVDVMFNAPAGVSQEQLAELHIRLEEKEDTGE